MMESVLFTTFNRKLLCHGNPICLRLPVPTHDGREPAGWDSFCFRHFLFEPSGMLPPAALTSIYFYQNKSLFFCFQEQKLLHQCHWLHTVQPKRCSNNRKRSGVYAELLQLHLMVKLWGIIWLFFMLVWNWHCVELESRLRIFLGSLKVFLLL